MSTFRCSRITQLISAWHECNVALVQAEKIMIDSEENKEYLPIQGLEAFNKATADLLLGQGHAATKV